MEGMHDIIPPAPVHGGLAGLIEQGGLPPSLLIGLIVLLLILAAALWLGRHRLIARLRRGQAERALRTGRPDQAEAVIRLHFGLAHLHPACPPHGIEPGPWRDLVEGLHAARFGGRPFESDAFTARLQGAFTPLSLEGRGAGGEGGEACPPVSSLPARGESEGHDNTQTPRLSPPAPQPSPTRGEGAKAKTHP